MFFQLFQKLKYKRKQFKIINYKKDYHLQKCYHKNSIQSIISY